MNHPFSGILVRYVMRSPGEAESGTEEHAGPEELEESVLPTEAKRQYGPKIQTALGALPDQLHVNLWEVRDPSVLDLGIMIGEWWNVKAIVVDLPWDIQREHVEDLGARLNSERTVAAIFNEVVNYNGSADQHYAKITFRPIDIAHSVENNNENLQCFFLLRLPAKYFSIQKISLGQGLFSSQLRINIPKPGGLVPDEPHPLYLRFRIDKVPQSIYSNSFEQVDKHLLSSSAKTRIIDFRINVRRGIPEEILAGFSSFKFPSLKKIHFFLTIGREQICDFESQNFVGCRALVDEKIWNDYLQTRPMDSNSEDMRQYLGYQWTASAKVKPNSNDLVGVKDLVVMGRFSSHTSNILKIIRFIVLGIVFGMIGSGLWEIVKSGIDGFEISIGSGWRTILALFAIFLVSLLVIIPCPKILIKKIRKCMSNIN